MEVRGRLIRTGSGRQPCLATRMGRVDRWVKESAPFPAGGAHQSTRSVNKKRPKKQGGRSAKNKMISFGGTWTADEVREGSSVVLVYAYVSCGPMDERIRTISGRGGSPKYLKREENSPEIETEKIN